MNPLNGAKPVPGPIIIIGVDALNGKRNCEWRTKIGTVGVFCGPFGIFFLSQDVATPLAMRPVFVVYLVRTAVM